MSTANERGQSTVMSQVNALSSSARSASYLILLQLFTRLLTFTFNQLILRHTTPAVFGFATIQLELLASTVLFLSREGFRIAIQRDKGSLQRCINLAFIPFGLGLAGSLLGCWVLWRGADAETQQIGGFGTSIAIYGIATVVELLGDPAFIVAQKMLWFKLRAISEGLAVASRCAITYVATAFLASRGTLVDYGAIPFALGQLVYAVVLTCVLSFSVAVFRDWDFRPKRIQREDTKGEDYMFYWPTLVLAFSVTGQSIFKHVLTEGDKFVLTMLTTPHIQGTYAIVSNYGIGLHFDRSHIRFINCQNPLPAGGRIVADHLISGVGRP
jgi:oligosaccharide translocation protein RFT1